MEAQKRKTIIIYAAAGLILLAVAGFIIYLSLYQKSASPAESPIGSEQPADQNSATGTPSTASTTASSSVVIPKNIEYATESEKTDMLGIYTPEPDDKIQVLSRDAKGRILDYKIIPPAKK